VLTSVGLWTFLIKPVTLVVLAVVLALAWPVSASVARRAGCPRTAALLFVLAVGGVLALTLTPNEPPPDVFVAQPPHFLTQIGNGHLDWASLIAAPDDDEQWANILLYLPIGLFGRRVWGSAARSALFGTALTVFVETCQYGIVGRSGSLTDIRNNTAGAIVGALVAATIRRLNPRAVAARQSGPNPAR
jgi:glycopeptide antibiotics resistance protein